MTIPQRLIIKGKRWKVHLKKDLRSDEDELVMGLCDSTNRIITINKSLKKPEQVLTFWHEFTHAVMHEAHISQNCSAGLSAMAEEIICESMGLALFELKKGKL